MADGTKIEWTDATANVVNGCSLASPGCINCYAMKQAHRVDARRGLTVKTKGGMVWTGETRFSETALLKVLRWRRPRRIFWNAHGDLFHESVPDEWIDRCFAAMALTPHHTHQVLTKRSARMRAYMAEFVQGQRSVIDAGKGLAAPGKLAARLSEVRAASPACTPTWVLPNVWLGVSVEDQTRADERIPDLLATPAALRWISAEPLLGPLDLTTVHGAHWWFSAIDKRRWENVHDGHKIGQDHPGYPTLDWVVIGGESGPKARPMHPDWARSLRDQCAAADVPFLLKQWGEWYPAFANDCAVDASSVRETRELDGAIFHRIGKKAAGRLLDGVLHDGFPA